MSSLGTNVESRILTELWRQLAAKYGDVKFCEIRADLCIEGYPERNTPTILIYKDGDIRRQVVTLRELSGVKTSMSDLERLLADVGAINENDVRLKKAKDSGDEDETNGRKITRGKRRDEEDDEDWD